MTRKQPSTKQKQAMKILVEKRGKSISAAMREAGYSPATAKNPKNLTESDAWLEMMEKNGLDDASLARQHQELLKSARLDHMTFPLGPVHDGEGMPDTDEIDEHEDEGTGDFAEELSDDAIVDLLKSVNCTVRRIVHGRTARHVYFWSADNKARKDALDMAYKLKGRYAAEKHDLTSKGKMIRAAIVQLPPRDGGKA